MADVNEVNKGDKSRVDDLMLGLARGRIALGAVAFAMPALTAKVMGVSSGADPGRDYLTRMFGAREIALGAGYLLTKGPSRRVWARLGLAVDAMDTAAGLGSRRSRPSRATAMGTTAVAGAAAVLGAAKVARDLTR